MTARPILFPLPDRDFDVTEVSVPWKVLTGAGHRVVFATESGAKPAADPRLLGGLPFGLGAREDAASFYRELEASPEFQRPLAWSDLAEDDYSALFLAGGHAPGMRQYLASDVLQRFCARYWALARPVAAICHGVLVLSRTTDARTGRSVLWDKKTTCLPKYMERSAYVLTAWKLGKYYRTYPEYVQDEVCSRLRDPSLFARGPLTLTTRGTLEDDKCTWVVVDGNYVSGRWPGDAYRVAKSLLSLLG